MTFPPKIAAQVRILNSLVRQQTKNIKIMSVKKLRYLAIALLGVAVCSCQKEPDTSDLEDDYLIFTAYDTASDFSKFGTYVLPDSILIIGSSNEATYWKDADAQQIISEVASDMNSYGYTRSYDTTTADTGLQLSYIEDVTYFVDYNYPYWWWDYPYYWGPGWWGDWTDWYYPYYVYYGYTAGSLIVEMVNLQSRSESTSTLPVVWTAFISGLLTGSDDVDIQRTVEGVDQAYTQSPYLNKNK